MTREQPTAIWDSLVASALIGSEKQPAAFPRADGPLGKLMESLGAKSGSEDRFLSAAAAVSLYLDAGRLPLTVSSRAEPSEPDTLPACNPTSGWFIKEILSSNNEELLAEWLKAVAERGRRVPEEMLPALLESGAKDTNTRARLIPALGKRGEWLAAQNSDWNYVFAPETEDAWLTGARDARLAYIERLRNTDPNRARELALSTWDEEPPEDRAAILQVFRIRLSVQDEEFLERSLDDRRKEVRRAASELLASIPESALCRRMTDRARKLLAWKVGQKSGFLGIGRNKSALEVTLPQSCDKEMVRDGVEIKPRPGVGEKAWWLLQILSAVPPSEWCREWNASASEIISAAMQTEWKSQLLEGWTKAAIRHRDSGFAEALLPIMLSASENYGADVPGVMGVLSTARLEGLIIDNLRSGHASELLGNCRHYWSPDLSMAALSLIQRLLSGKAGMHQYEAGHLIIHFAGHISVSVYTEALSCLSPIVKQDNEWASLADKFLSILKFRHDMLEAI